MWWVRRNLLTDAPTETECEKKCYDYEGLLFFVV